VLNQSLYESGDEMAAVFFPTDSIISLLYVLECGDPVEISVVGHEGMLGVALFMGGKSTPGRAIVRCSGYAYRLPVHRLQAEFKRHEEMHNLLLRYAQSLMTQMTQTAVCNRYHSIDQQLCRWLLLCLDRLPGNALTMTQELIANMLGVRREGITEAAGRLQRDGAIAYRRGQIKVLNRPMLEKRSCECYTVVRTENDRLLDFFATPTSPGAVAMRSSVR